MKIKHKLAFKKKKKSQNFTTFVITYVFEVQNKINNAQLFLELIGLEQRLILTNKKLNINR